MSAGRDAIEALWQQVEQDWDHQAAHRALLLQAASPAELARVAKLYRAASATPQRAALAERQLKAIAATAMARFEVVERPRASGRTWKIALALFLLAASAALAAQL